MKKSFLTALALATAVAFTAPVVASAATTSTTKPAETMVMKKKPVAHKMLKKHKKVAHKKVAHKKVAHKKVMHKKKMAAKKPMAKTGTTTE